MSEQEQPRTRCWRNVPATVTVPVIEYDLDHPDPVAVEYHMREKALDDLRQQLADARAERDRYVARCKKLEARLERVREALE